MSWEPWTGCYPASQGCAYCYFYGPYSKRHGQNVIVKTEDFTKPLQKNAKGLPRLSVGRTVPTCFATDFFLPEADAWRGEAWAMMKARPDLTFLILTKRIERFTVALPQDWGQGYENVIMGCTVETQALADQRLPHLLAFPVRRRFIACAPLLEPIRLAPYLEGVGQVTVSGETGREARLCDLDWVLAIREECRTAQVSFWLKGTGSLFRRDGETCKVNPFRQASLAKELGLNLTIGERYD